jgi:hypothetical protein
VQELARGSISSSPLPLGSDGPARSHNVVDANKGGSKDVSDTKAPKSTETTRDANDTAADTALFASLDSRHPRPPVTGAVQVKLNVSAEPAQVLL